jgi:hypothetical protein
MRDSQFDDILKNKLNGLTSDQSPDWTRFLQEKQIADEAEATPDAIDQDFDAQIKDSIEAHRETRVPQWAAFLDKKTTLDNEADFDTQTRAALLKHQTQLPSQWEAFQAYRDKQPTTDSPHPDSGKEITVLPFDTLVKDTLGDFESTSKPDWAAFLDFKTKHEGVSPEAAQFDLQVKKELESYRAAETPAWVAFLDKKTQADIDYTADAPHAEFDAEVSYLTEQVQVTTPADWSAFKDFRDSHRFDEDIQSTVDDYQSDSQPQWEAFKDYRASQQFDGDIKSTIYDYQSDSTPQWEAFLKRKKEKDGVIADVAFDKGIGSTLGRVAAKYNSKHWLMLQARLQRIAALRKGIASYKGLEALFVALMLFTFSTHMGTLMDGVLSPQQTVQEVIPMTEAVVAQDEVPSIEEPSTTPTEAKAASTANSNSVMASAPVAQQSMTSSAASNTDTPVTSLAGSTAGNSNNNNNNSAQLPLAASTNNTTPAATLAKETEASIETPAAKALMAQLTDIVTGLDRRGEERSLKSPVAEAYVDPNIKKTYLDEGHWLHVFGGMEMNLVTTPADSESGLPSRLANPYGYNIEALYSRVKGDWEYELGLGFNAFNYEPFTEFIDDGQYDYNSLEGLNEVVFSRTKLKMLSVPMKLKWHFINNGRWSIYAGAGLNHDFIAQVDYEISDEVVIPNTGGQGNPPPPPVDWPRLYDERTYTTGLFNNGPLVEAFDVATKSNNYILRGSLSLGAERNISNNVAAYLRADYLPTLYNTEIGPYNDRINKLAVGMGFKFRIKGQ